MCTAATTEYNSIDQDRVFVRPVNAVRMCTHTVEANPFVLDASCVKLDASATVHPDQLAPLRQSCEVRLIAVEAFIWGSITKDLDGGLVLKPHSKVEGLAPECS